MEIRLSMDTTHLLKHFHAFVFLCTLQITCRDVGVQLLLATHKQASKQASNEDTRERMQTVGTFLRDSWGTVLQLRSRSRNVSETEQHGSI